MIGWSGPSPAGSGPWQQARRLERRDPPDARGPAPTRSPKLETPAGPPEALRVCCARPAARAASPAQQGLARNLPSSGEAPTAPLLGYKGAPPTAPLQSCRVPVRGKHPAQGAPAGASAESAALRKSQNAELTRRPRPLGSGSLAALWAREMPGRPRSQPQSENHASSQSRPAAATG